MSVSVIVPCYNGAKTIGACLAAIQAQTLRPAEIIVVDDASTDQTAAIAADLGVTVLTSPRNEGVAAARNRGVAASSGKILFLVDADVALEPDAIETAVRLLRENPHYGCVHGMYSLRPMFDDGRVETYRLLHSHYWHRRAAGPVRTVVFALAAMPRAVHDEIGSHDENLRQSEDIEYSGRLASRYPILLSERVVGRHDDDDRLIPLLRKQFRRSQYLVPVSAVARQPGGMRANAVSGVLAAGLTALAALAAPLAVFWPPLLALPFGFLLLFALANRGLLGFVRREKSLAFVGYVAVVHLLVNAAIVAGAAFGLLRWLVDENFGPTPRPDPEPAPSTAPRRRRRLVFSAVLVAGVLAAAWLAARDQDWGRVSGLLRPGALPTLLAACLIGLAGLTLAMASWRRLLVATTGHTTAQTAVGWAASARIYFVGFLAQQLPGRVWGLFTHVQLGRSAGIPATRMVTVYALSLPVGIVTGAVVGATVAPSFLGGQAWLLIVPALLAVGMFVRPRAVSLLVERLLQLAGRPLPGGVAPAGAMRASLALAAAGWLVSGLHLWLLAVLLGADPVAALWPCVGGFALATVAGSLVVFVPNGWGAREATLVVPLATVLPLPAAGVALVASRLVTFASELLAAALSVVLAKAADHPVPPVPANEVTHA